MSRRFARLGAVAGATGSYRNLQITSWSRDPDDSAFGVAVPGLKVTGWRPDSPPPLAAFAFLGGLWLPPNTIMTEVDILEDADGRKHQICAYIRIREYPSPWQPTQGSYRRAT